MLPSSAPILEPNFPAQISPVINGPKDRTIACDTSDGSHDSAPNEASDGVDCFVKTIPAINAVNVMRNQDLLPMAKHCLKISRPSYGGHNASFKNRTMKLYISAT